jgi:hypothetical protein
MKRTITIPHVTTLRIGHDSSVRHIALGKSPDFLVPACGAPVAGELIASDGADIPIDDLCANCTTAIENELPKDVVDAITRRCRERPAC